MSRARGGYESSKPVPQVDPWWPILGELEAQLDEVEYQVEHLTARVRYLEEENAALKAELAPKRVTWRPDECGGT